MVGAAVPAAAQFTPYTEVAGYTVAQIDASGVCFAATQLTSQANRDMVYTYYQAQAGQRWHVAGYQDASALESAILGWEKYKRHVMTKGQAGNAEKADQQIAKLEDTRERLQ